MPNPSFDINQGFTVRKGGKTYTMPIKLVVHSRKSVTLHIDAYVWQDQPYCVFAEIVQGEDMRWRLTASTIRAGKFIGAYHPNVIVPDRVRSMFRRVVCECFSVWLEGNEQTLRAMDRVNADLNAKLTRTDYAHKLEKLVKSEAWLSKTTTANGSAKTLSIRARKVTITRQTPKRVSIFWLDYVTPSTRQRIERLINGRMARTMIDDSGYVTLVYHF